MNNTPSKAWLALFRLSSMAGLLICSSCYERGTTVTDSGSVITVRGGVPDLIRARNERARGLKPESEWNRFGMWKKIKTRPPTYIPARHSINSPRTDEDGQWFTDHRDGKRLFVPNFMNGPSSSATLAVEARGIVDWQYSKGKFWFRNVDHRD